ncbi:hypothetical protein FRC00_004070 [Tulasnella sp. 408]|nr:hypothetical protein FRC00_004070 [Tulasnella sp. 408]
MYCYSAGGVVGRRPELQSNDDNDDKTSALSAALVPATMPVTEKNKVGCFQAPTAERPSIRTAHIEFLCRQPRPQDLPDIPTPIEPQAHQRPSGTTATIDPSSANTTTTEAKAEAVKSHSHVPLPPSAMMNASEELPKVNHTSESANSSASPSRTATPSTASYDTAGTLNVDWPLNMVVNTKDELVPFTRTFKTPSLASGTVNSSTITCATEYSQNGDGGIGLILDLGYPATLDLKMFNQFDSSRPISIRFRDTADLRLTGNHVQPSIMISLIITTTPPDVLRVPAAIEALASFLDQPGGHDVRASPHFRHLFAVRNRESGIVPGAGAAVGPTMGDGKSALADNSDVRATPTGEAGELRAGRSDSASSSRSRRMSERDITTITGSTVLTPMTSIHSDGVQDPQRVSLPIDNKGIMFQVISITFAPSLYNA